MSRSSKSSLHPSGCLVSHFMSYYVKVSQSPVEACNVCCNITKLWQKPHQSQSQGHQNLQAPMMTVYGGLWLTRSRTSNPHLAEQWHARYAVTLRSISNNFENRILWFASLRRLLYTHPDWRQTRDNLHQYHGNWKLLIYVIRISETSLGLLQGFIKIWCTSSNEPSSPKGGVQCACISHLGFGSQFHLTREINFHPVSDCQEEDGNLSQDFLLMSEQSDDSAPLGGLGLDRILDVNLNLDLAAVGGDFDLEVQYTEAEEFGILKFFSARYQTRSVFWHLLSNPCNKLFHRCWWHITDTMLTGHISPHSW